MKPFLKIDKRITRLNTTDAYIYFMLVYAKFTNKQISRAYLATCLGFKKEENDYITGCLKRIEDVGLIKRNAVYSKAHKENYIPKNISYKLIYEGSFMVASDFVTCGLDPKLKGFLLQLRSLCDYNKFVCIPRMTLAVKLHISRTTLDKQIKTLIDLGFLKTERDLYVGREYFVLLDNEEIYELLM